MSDCNSNYQARLAVVCRASLLFIYDPRKGEKIQRLSLVGNPAQKEDWWTPPKSNKALTFIDLPAVKDALPSSSIKTAIRCRLYWKRKPIDGKIGEHCMN